MRSRVLRVVIALIAAATGLPAATTFTAAASAAEPAAVFRPVATCEELARTFTIPGAVTHVDKAQVRTVTGQPRHCLVEGYVEPAVRFTLKLPMDTYGGRYLQYGCGGLCGAIEEPGFPACGGPPSRDMAVAATDDGHTGEGGFYDAIVDGRALAGNRAARADYFYRAPHVVSVAAKQIIKTFYGSTPKHSYFNGCSTGGREGLLLAQRYPADFDGIVAGAPAAYMGPLLGVYFTWLSTVNNDRNGSPIITAAKLPALHRAVLRACDRRDGLTDDQIDDPHACRFDPVAIQCKPGTDQPNCLTPAQVTVTRKLYDGPRDPHGRRLYPGWQNRGSELAWDGSIIPNQYGSLAKLPDNYLKYVGYPIGKPHSSIADFQFTARQFHRLTPEGAKGNAMSLDLSEFRRRGGKLLLWHGWDDQSIPAVGTLDYYQRLTQRNGGLHQTQTWARTFMVPTMYHCTLGGYRMTTFDPFPQLTSWVEHGTAPDRIIATGTDANNHPRTRPVFPYPQQAKYDGSGDINDAGNFTPTNPSEAPNDTIPWIGSYLHTLPGPTAP
ncbi:tannase/feruloyl esterase family alpha/beta hydrolase [Actinomadura sp. 6N118]|uniref:tannase/feruloyl esterase family alpha/beta hydrolase n=1 Tax=Actinomadura sp. 6N118 TaxID=3375151 RepID=UPI00379E9729